MWACNCLLDKPIRLIVYKNTIIVDTNNNKLSFCLLMTRFFRLSAELKTRA